MNSEPVLNQQQALSQISYMRQLLEDTRLHVADGYPFYLLWGVIWIIGYSGGLWLAAPMIKWMWLVLVIVGTIGSIVLGYRQADGSPETPLSRKLMWLNLLGYGMLFSLPFVFGGFRSVNAINAYFPFFVGFIYIINGIFIGREMVMIGSWLMIVGVTSLFIPYPAQLLWLAIAGGGSLITTAYLLRRQAQERKASLKQVQP